MRQCTRLISSAFAKLQKVGLSANDIAARFGFTATVVLQRLKLAAVSPRLIAEYRFDMMSLEQLMAFAISDDRIDAAVVAGRLQANTFENDLDRALDAEHLGADHAVLFQPTSGSLVGSTFMIVDANHTAGMAKIMCSASTTPSISTNSVSMIFSRHIRAETAGPSTHEIANRYVNRAVTAPQNAECKAALVFGTRIGIVITILIFGWASLHYFRAAHRLPHDLEAGGR